MEESEFVSADKSNANKILAHLLKSDVVRKDLRIKFDGNRVMIPVKIQNPLHKYKSQRGSFQRRELAVPPAERIREIMESLGSELEIPSKFIKFGKALVFKDSRLGRWSPELLESTAKQLGVECIYIDTGIGSDVKREPVIKLLYGPGGDTVHFEGGIKYCFDPARVMFSPGNVNIRIAKGREDLDEKTVLDMFAGIGYFSLHAASNNKVAGIFSCEINPVSFQYLKRNIGLNSLEKLITPLEGDCRKLPSGLIADHIIMGHFDCLDFMATALLHSRKGTTIDFHLLVDTGHLNSHWKEVARRARSFGYTLCFLEQKVVKSYGPHLWHIVVTMSVENLPFKER